MKRNSLIIKIICAHAGSVIVILSIIASLEFFLTSLFLENITFLNYITYFVEFLFGQVFVIIAIFESFFFIFLYPIQKAINNILDNKKVDPVLLKKAKNRIFKIPLFSVILNAAGFIGGYFFYFSQRTDIANFFKMQEIFYFIFAVSSAGVYAFIQVTICNQILAKAREMLTIYYLDEHNGSREISLRVRTILLTILLSIYSLAIFIFGQTWVYETETFYANLLENVNKKTMSLEEARMEYIAFLKPLTKTENGIRFPFMNSTYSERKSRYNTYFLTAFFALVFIGAVTVFMFSRELISQIRMQHETLQNILKGKKNLSTRMNIIQNDEVGFLTSTINKLMDKLKEILMQIAESSDSVFDSSRNLDENIHILSTASEEIFASINQINRNTSNQIDVVSRTNSELKSMLDYIQKISENVIVQTNFVEETSSAVQEMTNSIKYVNKSTTEANRLAVNLVRVANEGGKAVGDTIEAIRNIQKASGEVKDIIELISSIASQTDLLSMNASIEAAQAGSAGKGFAVVADEIRKLAESSSEQASKINFHIKDMYSKVINGVKLSEEAERAFKRIVDDIRMTTELITEVSGAMEQQNVGTSQILSSISNLVASTEEVKEMTERLKEASGEIKVTMEELDRISSEIKDSTNEQEIGNKEVLDKVNHLKEVSLKNEAVVRKLQSIVADFAQAEIVIKKDTLPENQNFGVAIAIK